MKKGNAERTTSEEAVREVLRGRERARLPEEVVDSGIRHLES